MEISKSFSGELGRAELKAEDIEGSETETAPSTLEKEKLFMWLLNRHVWRSSEITNMRINGKQIVEIIYFVK